MNASPAEQLLQDLGITDPTEIDLEAIAFHAGANVRYRQLYGCEARILGHGNQAIITVNTASPHQRQRFSIAHELGHWHFHRGKCLSCRVDEYVPRSTVSPERIADEYAADLLMPSYLLKPLIKQYKSLDFKTVGLLADAFQTSRTAMAIRLVEQHYWPAMLVCHGKTGRRWFTRSNLVPTKWFPQNELDPESFSFDILFGAKPGDTFPRKIGADAWFDRQEAQRFEIFEQTFRTMPGEILTLLLIKDPEMLE